jgi:hypothetical protein
MSRDEIGLDQIQQRLGNFGRQQPAYDDFDVVGAEPSAEASPGSAGGGTFIATTVAIFLAVGAGTYFFMNGGDISGLLGLLRNYSVFG